ncbi:hypothetical protein NDU88_003914 [Pleurodeles waltl]|uniref:Uncharacterized protein n=1 Tax=Pleurodeles waltl TaxID=8319 RepID=A0AAV7MZZ4_PLEWA|nr:hypothetical protein NDU88_003914 [Pleurodeles waltl]
MLKTPPCEGGVVVYSRRALTSLYQRGPHRITADWFLWQTANARARVTVCCFLGQDTSQHSGNKRCQGRRGAVRGPLAPGKSTLRPCVENAQTRLLFRVPG